MKKIALILTLILITATVCVPLTSFAENTRTYTTLLRLSEWMSK